jgi:hypothetical protein
VFESIGKYLNSARGWIWIVATVGPTVATFVAGVLEGLPWSHRIVLVTAALASGAVLAYHTLGAYERISGWWGTRKEGERLACQLEELIGVGHAHLRIGEIAQMWSGEAATEYQQNVCLRRLKQGAQEGMIKFEPPAKDGPNKNSKADLRDCVTFFRERKWLALPPIPPPSRTPPKSPGAQPAQQSPFARRVRSNWVTGWRR